MRWQALQALDEGLRHPEAHGPRPAGAEARGLEQLDHALAGEAEGARAGPRAKDVQLHLCWFVSTGQPMAGWFFGVFRHQCNFLKPSCLL